MPVWGLEINKVYGIHKLLLIVIVKWMQLFFFNKSYQGGSLSKICQIQDKHWIRFIENCLVTVTAMCIQIQWRRRWWFSWGELSFMIDCEHILFCLCVHMHNFLEVLVQNCKYSMVDSVKGVGVGVSVSFISPLLAAAEWWATGKEGQDGSTETLWCLTKQDVL